MNEEKVRIYAFFQTGKDNTGPYFFSGVAPALFDDAIWSDDLIYATGTGETPEDAVAAFRQNIWAGL